MGKFPANRYHVELPNCSSGRVLNSFRRLHRQPKLSTQPDSKALFRNSLLYTEIENGPTFNAEVPRRILKGIRRLHYQQEPPTQLDTASVLVRNLLYSTEIEKRSTLNSEPVAHMQKIPQIKHKNYKKKVDSNEKIVNILYIDTLLLSKIFSSNSNIFECKSSSKTLTKVVEIRNGRRFVRMDCIADCNLDSTPELYFSKEFSMNDFDLEYGKNNSISEYDYRIAERYPSSNFVHQDKFRFREQGLVSPDSIKSSYDLSIENRHTNHQVPLQTENAIFKRFLSNIKVVPKKMYQTCLVLKNEPISYIWESTSEHFNHDTEFVFNMEHSSISYNTVTDEKVEFFDKSGIKECLGTNFNRNVSQTEDCESSKGVRETAVSDYDEVQNRKKVLDSLEKITDSFIKELDADVTDCLSMPKQLEEDFDKKYLFNSFVNNSLEKDGVISLDGTLVIQNPELETKILAKCLGSQRPTSIDRKSYESLKNLATIDESIEENSQKDNLSEEMRLSPSEQSASVDFDCKLSRFRNEYGENKEVLMLPSESTLLLLDNILFRLQNAYRIVEKEVHSWMPNSRTYQSGSEIENFGKETSCDCFTNSSNYLMKCVEKNTNSHVKKCDEWGWSSSIKFLNSITNDSFENKELISLDGSLDIQYSEPERNKLDAFLGIQKSTFMEEKSYESLTTIEESNEECYIPLLDNIENNFNDKTSLVSSNGPSNYVESEENERLPILPSESALLLLDSILFRLQNTYRIVEKEVHSWLRSTRPYHSDSKIHETSCESVTTFPDENDCSMNSNYIMIFKGRNADTAVRKESDEWSWSSSNSDALVSHLNSLSKFMQEFRRIESKVFRTIRYDVLCILTL